MVEGEQSALRVVLKCLLSSRTENDMRTQCALVSAAFFFASAPIASAYTQADAAACTPDALRLCAAYIPNAGAITGCLRANRARLTEACSVVMQPPAVRQVKQEITGAASRE
jgi:hypothetical protein